MLSSLAHYNNSGERDLTCVVARGVRVLLNDF